MNQKQDALAQFHDLMAGALYDVANKGQPENDDLYETFRTVATNLLDTFDIEVIEDNPLKVELTLK